MTKESRSAGMIGLAALFTMAIVLADEEPWGWNGSQGVNGNGNWSQGANWQSFSPPSGDDYPGETAGDTAVVTIDDATPAANVIQSVAGLQRLKDLTIGDGHKLTLDEEVNVERRLEISGDVDLAGDSALRAASSAYDNLGYLWIFSEDEDTSVDVTGTGGNRLDASRAE